MITYLHVHDIESMNPPFQYSFRLRPYTLSSPFNDEMLEDGTVRERLTEGRYSSVERDPDSFHFGASCHSFSLKVFYVFEQTVTPIDTPIICAYAEYTGKDGSSFNFNSDRICNLG